MRRLFCFGLGYTGLALAKRLGGEGWRVAGTTRSAEHLDRLKAEGVDAILFDGERSPPDLDSRLAEATHLLSTVPPDEAGDPVLGRCAGSLHRLDGLLWAGYLSTTGVYGDRRGGTVDESAPLQPTGERGRRRVAAERGWLRLQAEHGLPVHVFRLAGIYGPGRSALDALRQGRARRIVRPGQLFSRIHVEDIVTILAASMAKPNPGAVYNLADDEAAAPEAVVDFAAQLLGVPPPPSEPFETAPLSPMARSFYADSKRVSNRRIKDELGVRLAYPTYREGLRALLAQMKN